MSEERAVPAPAGGIEVPLGGLQEGETGLQQRAVPADNSPVVPAEQAVQTDQPVVPVEQPVQPIQEQVPSSNDLLLKAVGVDGDGLAGAMEKALQHGDPSLINLSEITKGMKPEQAALVQQIAESKYREVQAHISTSVSQVHQLAGGQAQWESARAAFNTKAPSYLQPVIDNLIQQGNIVDAGRVVLDFVKQNGLVNTQGQPAIQGGVGNVQQGMSNAEFKEALDKIMTEYPNQSLQGNGIAAQKYKQITAQRAAGRNAGL